MKILIPGSVNQDLVVRMERIPKPGETLFGQTLHYFPGGKGANQAIAASNLGGDVHFVGKVGNDAFGENLKKYLASHNLVTSVETVADAPTGTAIITVDERGENAITVISGANHRFQTSDTAVLEGFGEGDLLLVQNEINLPVVQELIQKAKEKNMTVVYNPAPAFPVPEEVRYACDYVVVNEHELGICFGKPEIDFANDREINRVLSGLATQYGITVILTLGEKGCKAANRDEIFNVEGLPVLVADTTGAGDCFCGAFVASIAQGHGLLGALQFANRAAAYSVTKLGASVSYPYERNL